MRLSDAVSQIPLHPSFARFAGGGPDPAPDGALPPVLDESDPRSRTVLVSLLDLPEAARRQAVADVAKDLSATGESPVFITDDTDFSVFSGDRLFYEYLPPVEDQIRHAPGQRWDLYIAEKLKTIIAKWKPVRTVSIGLPLPDFIQKTAAAHRELAREF